MKTVELLLRLDRTDSLVAQSLADGDGSKRTYMTEDKEPAVEIVMTPPPPKARVRATNLGGIDPGDPALAFLAIDGYGPKAQYYIESDDESEDSEADEFDMEVWDDDGGPLVDDNGHTLVPMDENVEYDESTAQKLMTFAVTYRQVRGALQGQRKR